MNRSRLPLQVRIDILVELTDSAIEHEDPRKALEFVDQARKILEENAWLPENYIPLEARLAALRFRAGAKNEAKLELQSALERFEKQRAGIVDIYRAGALRPVAEAYEAMGEHAAALATYKRVVEEGLANPNSRPRAEDLVATSVALAKGGGEPDAELWEKLEKAVAGLQAPW